MYEQQCKKLDVWPDRVGGIEDDVWRAHEIGQDEFRDFLGKREYVITAASQDAGAEDQADTREPLSTSSKTGLQQGDMTGSSSLNTIYMRLRNLSHTHWSQAVSANIKQCHKSASANRPCTASSALIHLATGYRFNSRDIGMEALAMLACLHDRDLPKYSIDHALTRPSSYASTSSILKILHRVAADNRFTDVASLSQADVLRKREDAVLDHWNSWDVSSTASTPASARKALEQVQLAAVALAVSNPSISSSNSPASNADLLVPLRSAHAVRVLLPLAPARFIVPFLRQWLLSTILLYVSAGCPKIDISHLNRVSFDEDRNKAYKHVRHTILSRASSTESSSQTLQALVALAAAEACWGQDLSAEAQQGLVVGGLAKQADEMTEEQAKTQEKNRCDWWLKAAMMLVDAEMSGS